MQAEVFPFVVGPRHRSDPGPGNGAGSNIKKQSRLRPAGGNDDLPPPSSRSAPVYPQKWSVTDHDHRHVFQ